MPNTLASELKPLRAPLGRLTRTIPLKRLGCRLLVGVALTLMSPSLHAQMAPNKEVRLVIAADEQEALAIELVARELLDRLNVAVSVVRIKSLAAGDLVAAKADPHYVAEVWVNFASAQQVTLSILDTATDRMLVRVLPRTEGEAEITREALGRILETTTEGLLSGAPIGAPRSEVMRLLEPSTAAPNPPAQPPPTRLPPSPALPPPPTPEAPRGPWFRAGAFYEATRFTGGGLIAHGPLGSLLARVPTVPLHPGAWLTAQYRQPMQVGTQTVGARISGGALRLLGTIDSDLGERGSVLVGLGGGVDLVRSTAQTSNPELFALTNPRLFKLPVMRAAAAVKWRIAPFTIAEGGLLLDADLSSTRFVVTRSTGIVEVLAPSTFRPGLFLGLEVP